MDCKICGRAIEQTFASLFSSRKVHHSCEQTFLEEKLVAYPFLEGFLYVDYVSEKSYDEEDLLFFEQFYMGPSVQRMLETDMLILFLEDGLEQDDLYRVFLLSEERLYWVFFQRPYFLE